MKLTKRTYILLALLTFILPLLGNKDLINYLHIKVLVDIVNYLIPFLFIISLLYDGYKTKYKYKINITSGLGILFIVTLLISLIKPITLASYTFTNLYKFIVLAFLICTVKDIDMKDNESKFTKIFLYLIIIISTYGILQYIFSWDLTLNGIEKYPGSHGRIKSTLMIATILDKFMAISIIYIYYLLYNRKNNIYLLLITLVLAVITLGLTFSRTGLLIFILTCIILFIYFIIKKRWLLLLTIPIVLIGIYLIPGQKYVTSSIAKLSEDKLSNTPISNLYNKVADIFIIPIDEIKEDVQTDTIDEQLTGDEDASESSREYFENVALNIIKSNPLKGIGIGNYNYIFLNQNANEFMDNKIANSTYLYPHNMYYQLTSEIGIIGGLLFFVLLISILYKNINIFSILLLLAILISSKTESLFYIKDITYFTIIIYSILNNKSLKKKN